MIRFPDASMGNDLGMFKTVYAGIGSLGPSYVGLVGGNGRYGLGFLGLVPVLLVSIGTVLWAS